MRAFILVLLAISAKSMIFAKRTSDSQRWKNICGRHQKKLTRIVNGKTVNPHLKYPWHVGIRTVFERKYSCGGSLITDRHVITAAHCLFRDSHVVAPVLLIVGIGDSNMMTKKDDLPGVTKYMGVREVVPHPFFGMSAFTKNDIGLIVLDRSIDFHFGIRPICLPSPGIKHYSGSRGILTGWGFLYSGGMQPEQLQEVSLPVLDYSCGGHKIPKSQLCTGTVNGTKDGCNGDSGGPLIVMEGERYVQIGIASYAPSRWCAMPGKPLVFTRVSYYLEWIQKQISQSNNIY